MSKNCIIIAESPMTFSVSADEGQPFNPLSHELNHSAICAAVSSLVPSDDRPIFFSPSNIRLRCAALKAYIDC
jgi:hypothetical protein